MIRSKNRQVSQSAPMSSTADIAFLLLIFFLVTTTFPKDKGLALVLPQEKADVAASNVLHFLLPESGGVEIRYGDSPQTRAISAAQVQAIWRNAADQNSLLIASIQTGSGTAYGRTIEVMDELRQAGAARVSLQVLGGPG